MSIQRTEETIALKHPNGASAEILFYGATVISWISAPFPSSINQSTNTAPTERLFLSDLASLDGSKPVRGGIPICWPIFATPSPDRPEHARLKQHGLARGRVWKWGGEVRDAQDSVSVCLTLEPDEEIKKIYAPEFKLVYTVTLASHTLTTSLQVHNPSSTGSAPLEFQLLFHNYLRGDYKAAEVRPLKGVGYVDMDRGGRREVEEREVVDVREVTVKLYESAGGKYTLSFPPTSGGLEIKTVNLPDLTVWNPGEAVAATIADMEPGGWERYVGVEPGRVREFVRLGEGEEWVGEQEFRAL